MLAAHMDIEDATHRDRVQRFWRSPTIAAQAGPEGRRHVPRRRRRPHQGAVDHGDQSRRLHARCRQRRGRDPRLPVRRRLGRDRRNRHGAPGARAPAGGGMGREERHRHQFRAAHLAPAQLPAARPATRVPTGGSSARSPAAWASTARSPMPSRRRSSPSTPRCRRSRTAARAISTSARWPPSTTRQYEDLDPFQWPRAAGCAAPARMFADGRFFTPDGKARFVDVKAGASADSAGLPADAQHRPRARPLAHHDAHRQKPAPVAALRRAVRRDPPAGRCALSHRRCRPRARLDRARRHPRARAADAAPAARLDLRAHALERPVRLPRARRRAGRGDHRPDFRTAGLEEHPGARRALRRRHLRLRGAAPQAGEYPGRVLGDRQMRRRLARRVGVGRRCRRLDRLRRRSWSAASRSSSPITMPRRGGALCLLRG